MGYVNTLKEIFGKLEKNKESKFKSNKLLFLAITLHKLYDKFIYFFHPKNSLQCVFSLKYPRKIPSRVDKFSLKGKKI